jgi:hypothetical protein
VVDATTYATTEATADATAGSTKLVDATTDACTQPTDTSGTQMDVVIQLQPQLRHMTVRELREECVSRGIISTGRRQELLQRLE